MVGFLIELRIQRNDTAIGVLELVVETHQIILPLTQLRQRTHELAVLLLQLFVGANGSARRQLRRDSRAIGASHQRRAGRQDLLQQDFRTGPGLGLDLHLIHQPVDAHHPDPHAGLRAVLAAQHFVEIRDSRAFIAHARHQ